MYFPLISQGQNLDKGLVDFKPSRGAFEVSYEGNLLWSRLQSGQWPDIKELVERAKKMVELVINGRDVSHLCFK